MESDADRRGPAGPPLLEGAGAGFVATVPMSIAMLVLLRLLPPIERGPLPPEQIALQAADQQGPIGRLAEPWRTLASVSTHFGFGSAAGAAYALVSARLPLPPVLRGVVYGLAVWATSYLGWLPALGILSPATDYPARRNLLMIVAHVVWGAVTGLLLERVEARQEAAPQ